MGIEFFFPKGIYIYWRYVILHAGAVSPMLLLEDDELETHGVAYASTGTLPLQFEGPKAEDPSSSSVVPVII